MRSFTVTSKVLAAGVLTVLTLSSVGTYVYLAARPQVATSETVQTPVTAIMAGELHYPLSAEQQALQQQRVLILTEIVKGSSQQRELGIVKPEQVFADQQALLLAKLSLADQPQQQKAVLTEMQQLYQQLAKRQEGEFSIGMISVVELYRTRAKLLEIEMLLLQVDTAAQRPL